MKKNILLATLILSMTLLTACQKDAAAIGIIAGTDKPSSSSASSSESSSSAPEFEANPQAAIDELYMDIDMMGLVDAQDEDLTDRFLIPLEIVDSYAIRYSMGRFGVADTYIIKPVKGKEEEVEDKLLDIKDSRIKEFEKYNIMDSYPISQNAEVYIRGEYVIMVMHQDNAGAKDIIKKYIPN